MCVEDWRRHHEVSILTFGEGRCFGCCPRKKVSMMRMRSPQQGQGCPGAFGSSGLALTALTASIGMSGTASNVPGRNITIEERSVENREGLHTALAVALH